MDKSSTPPKPKRSYEELIRLAAERSKVKSPEKPVQMSLELWPDAVRGVPNAVLRGALFGVSTERKAYKTRTLIAALDGYEIRYLGVTLNQTDLDVWETLLHLARLQPLGTQVEFAAHSLLKTLSRGTSGSDHERLKEEMARLAAGTAEITWLKEKKTFVGSLISSFFRDEETGRYVVKFNQDMAQLYGVGHTLIDWSARQSLGKNNLAKWLHGFYSSHAQPFPYKVETLYKLCGATTKQLRDFRGSLRVALNHLKASRSIISWDIDPETDLVTVVTVPSGTQAKHIERKRPRSKKSYQQGHVLKVAVTRAKGRGDTC
jgi:hypothetical protein